VSDPAALLALLKHLRRRWRREASRSKRCIDACRAFDNKFQLYGEQRTFAACADEIDRVIREIEEDDPCSNG
jgi:hypothetical protein